MIARTAVALALLALASCQNTVALRNQTGVVLTSCPVVTTPPPPHRVCSGTLDDGQRVEIDTGGFNPLYWDPISKLGFIIQLDMSSTPQHILVRVYQYQVPPGQEEPGTGPTPINDYPFAIDPDGGKNVRIRAGPIDQQIPITFAQG